MSPVYARRIAMMAALGIGLAACTTPSRSDAGPDVVDVAVTDVTDAPLEDVSDASPRLRHAARALIVDSEVRHYSTWIDVIAAFRAAGLTVDYRRYLPHVTPADVAPIGPMNEVPYEIIVVALGRAPGSPASLLRIDEVAATERFVRQGGVLLLAPQSLYGDTNAGDNDWFVANRILEQLDVGIRIDRNSVIGAAYAGMPSPPHVPTAGGYPTALEFTIGYAYGFTTTSHPTAARADRVAAGSVPTLRVAREDVQVLLRTHERVYLWQNRGGPADQRVVSSGGERPLAAVAPVNDGFVAVVPRGTLTISSTSGWVSDKPALDLDRRDATRHFVEDLAAHLHALASSSRRHEVTHPLAFDELFSVSAPGFEPLHPTAMITAVRSNIAQRPLPAAVPSADTVEAPPSTPAPPPTRPTWFGPGRARIGYGGLSPDRARMSEVFAEADRHGLDAVMTTTQPERLRTYTGTRAADERAMYASVATLARAARARWFIGGYLSGSLWADNRDAYPRMVGANGQIATAPAPVDEQFWNQIMIPTCETAGQLARDNPGIAGLHFDLELYNGPVFHNDGYSFSDSDLAVYLAGSVPPADAAALRATTASNRLDELVDRGLLRGYFDSLESAAARWGARCREAAHAAAPNLEFMVYVAPFPNSWFYHGLLRGLGTPARPVIALTYEAWGDRPADALRADGVSVEHIGGTIVGHWRPDDFDDALATLGAGNDGYWIFTFNDLSATNPMPPALHGATSDYWNALEAANRRLAPLR